MPIQEIPIFLERQGNDFAVCYLPAILTLPEKIFAFYTLLAVQRRKTPSMKQLEGIVYTWVFGVGFVFLCSSLRCITHITYLCIQHHAYLLQRKQIWIDTGENKTAVDIFFNILF